MIQERILNTKENKNNDNKRKRGKIKENTNINYTIEAKNHIFKNKPLD